MFIIFRHIPTGADELSVPSHDVLIDAGSVLAQHGQLRLHAGVV
jgi:hypothetical protein